MPTEKMSDMAEKMKAFFGDEALQVILKFVKDMGAVHCSGSCEQRRPDEIHCYDIGPSLEMSTSAVRDRLFSLVDMGLMKRRRVPRAGLPPVTEFALSPVGEKVLAFYEKWRSDSEG
jgi:DNA-binding HxlR family transcriptional regulator